MPTPTWRAMIVSDLSDPIDTTDQTLALQRASTVSTLTV